MISAALVKLFERASFAKPHWERQSSDFSLSTFIKIRLIFRFHFWPIQNAFFYSLIGAARHVSLISLFYHHHYYRYFSFASPRARPPATTTITSQGNKPILPDIIPIQSPLEGRSKWRMQPWDRDRGTLYLHPKRLCNFRGKRLRVSPLFTFTDPLLLRWQKFIKNKKSDEGGRRGVDLRRGWNREANLGK